MHKNEHHPYEYTDSLTSLSPKANLSQKKTILSFKHIFTNFKLKIESNIYTLIEQHGSEGKLDGK